MNKVSCWDNNNHIIKELILSKFNRLLKKEEWMSIAINSKRKN